MKNGFSFKGIHSSDMGITVRTESRPIIPDVKKTEYSALLMDGAYDFSRANPYNREFYNNRTFKVQLYINGSDISELNKKLVKISQWLTGTGDLIFDDTPLVKWKARRNGEIAYAPELKGKKAILSVEFSVSAFGYSVVSTCEDIILDSQILLDTNIPLDMAGTEYTFASTIESGTTYALRFINYGERPVRPVITITTGDTSIRFTGITLTYNGTECSCSSANHTYIVDCEKQQIRSTLNDNSGMMSNFNGEFFEFEPGLCELDVMCTFAGTANFLSVTITVDFEPQVYWDFDMDNVDWSKNDA